MNFNEIFRKSVTCDNFKNTKSLDYTLSLENTISENHKGEYHLFMVNINIL